LAPLEQAQLSGRDFSAGTVTTMRRLAVRIKAGQVCANVLDDDRNAHNKTIEAKDRLRMLVHQLTNEWR
jgi:hypothetical protein